MSVPRERHASDFYSLLGVGPDASLDEIKRAYRKLAVELHPDRNPDDPETEARFKDITLAYQTLISPARRQRYDVERRRSSARLVLWKGPPMERRGDDLTYRLDIAFEQMVLGATSSITFPRKSTCGECGGSGAALERAPTRVPPCADCGGQGRIGEGRKAAPCPRCNGRGLEPIEACPACAGDGRREEPATLDVPVPPGIESGRRLRLAGWGDDGQGGGESGNLFVVVTVLPHALLARDKDDVTMELPVSLAQALLGAEIDVPTAEGIAPLKVPPGSSHGTLLKMKAKGVKRADGARGDQLVRVSVTFPESLTEEQRATLESFAKSRPAETEPKIREYLATLKKLGRST